MAFSNYRIKTSAILALLAIVFLITSCCGSIVQSATRPMIENMLNSVNKQQDLQLVADGAPAFIMLMEGVLEGDPENEALLHAAAGLYSAYNGAFVAGKNPERALLMSARARELAFAAMSMRNEKFAEVCSANVELFEAFIPTIEAEDVPQLFSVIMTWAAYLQARKGDYDEIANLPKIQALARRLLELDETYFYGSGHLVMGTLKTLLPPLYGGKPEEARRHFERAIEISDGKFLQAKVMFAKSYARLVFNRELHDRLLQEVIDTPANVVPLLTLANTMARLQARKLLDGADEYF
jgi:tetratricopeptide (TPR) repeat protein